eukprot:TRINITY_DN8248_c0_g2_i5.p1 TRINITY_DN8248_c0_g2~~TRINITY_DN8248_c0_g2_i5.p1  ORF type:complete len:350 (+),score=48.24 TRINITY_DN8248_c0_g2_i5:53-1051(+)
MEICHAHAHAFRAHGLELLPVAPHDDDDRACMYAHPGPSPLDMDVEGMLGVRVLETDDDHHFWGLKYEPAPDFENVGMTIEDTFIKEMEDYNASARTYQGYTYGAQLPTDNYGESLAPNLSCLNTALLPPHEQGQHQLFSASPIPPCEEQRGSYRQSNSGNAPASALCNATYEDMQGEERRTTVMLMNVPLGYTSSKLMYTLDSEGFASMYDFIYVPMVAARTAKGYAFVNLVNPSIAQRFVGAFNGFTRWSTASKNVCHVVWASKHQGLRANISHYKNSTVLGESVPSEYKPRIFKNGEEMPFPPSTRKPCPPTRRVRRPRKTQGQQAISL